MTLDALWRSRDVTPFLPLGVIILVACERCAELWLSRRNQKFLVAAGGYEVGARHYPLLVGLHAIWLAATAGWVILLPARISPALLGMFVLLQPVRVWVIATFGRFWTTRIITVPAAPLVRRGPYRYLRHPNYTVVILEIALLPLAIGAWPLALAFSLLNAAVLYIRIACENTTLDARGRSAIPPADSGVRG